MIQISIYKTPIKKKNIINIQKMIQVNKYRILLKKQIFNHKNKKKFNYKKKKNQKFIYNSKQIR